MNLYLAAAIIAAQLTAPPPATFINQKFVEGEINKWGPVIKAAGQYAD